MLPHRDSKDVFILGGTDDIQVLLDDSQVNISTIAGSRHVGPIKPRVEDWSKKLALFSDTLVSGVLFRNKMVFAVFNRLLVILHFSEALVSGLLSGSFERNSMYISSL